VNRTRLLTLLVLVLVVIGFVVTWISVPSSPSDHIALPASLFLPGIGHTRKHSHPSGPVHVGQHGLDHLKRRIAVVYGSAAAVVVVAGLALGAARRPKRP
jgi:hypothetical protein